MDNKQRARELLADEYERGGQPFLASRIRAGGYLSNFYPVETLRAIEAALEQAGAVGGEWPERFACNGPQGTFWTDDSALANKLIIATFDRDEWTVTDTQRPKVDRHGYEYGCKPAPAAVAGGVVTEELAAAVLTEYIARRQEDGEGDRFPPELVAQARVDDMRAALNSALAAQPAAGDAVPARIVELADRLVAPGPKAAHVSASECHEIRDFIADLASPTTQRPSVVDDTARLDWIDGQIQCYGDGYTEPREAGWCVQWQQSKPGEYWTNLRDWVDAEMRQTDDLTAALRPESGEA